MFLRREGTFFSVFFRVFGNFAGKGEGLWILHRYWKSGMRNTAGSCRGGRQETLMRYGFRR